MHGGFTLDVERILLELTEERDRLNQAIGALAGLSSPSQRKIASPNGNGEVSSGRPRRRLTPAGRKRLSEIMTKRWAEKRRKAKSSVGGRD